MQVVHSNVCPSWHRENSSFFLFASYRFLSSLFCCFFFILFLCNDAGMYLWLSVSGRLSLPLNTPQHHPVRTFYGELSKNFDKAPWQTIVNQHPSPCEELYANNNNNWQSKLCMTLLSHAGTNLDCHPRKSWNSS